MWGSGVVAFRCGSSVAQRALVATRHGTRRSGNAPKLPTEGDIAAVLRKLEQAQGASASPSARNARDQQQGFLGHYEQPGGFAFCVGDIVKHRIHGQIGVVAERFDGCQLGEAWLSANGPKGLNPLQPFYTIFVSMPKGVFTRHGAQSTHRRWDASVDGGLPPPVKHPGLPQLFHELNEAAARYEPLNEADASQKALRREWDKSDE